MTADLIESLRARRERPDAAEAKRIRQASGATHGEVADALGVHRLTVLRWEAGTRIPRGATADRYYALLAALAEVAGE